MFLSEKDKYLLYCLNEEASEIIFAISKTLRFGPDSTYPSKAQPERNIEVLNRELTDLLGVVELLKEKGIVKIGSNEMIEDKKSKVQLYLNRYKHDI